jgi:hypothetical protein
MKAKQFFLHVQNYRNLQELNKTKPVFDFEACFISWRYLSSLADKKTCKFMSNKCVKAIRRFYALKTSDRARFIDFMYSCIVDEANVIFKFK